MKIQDVSEFVQKLEFGDPTTCVYQYIYNENHSDDKKKHYALTGIMHHGRYLCGAYIIRMVIKS